MDKSYRRIRRELANRIKLIMTDIDGTLLASGRNVSSEVEKALRLLQRSGIIVGLVSGRTLRELEIMSKDIGLKGPVIAENGGVAKLTPEAELLDMGYSRKPAIEALHKLKQLYPDSISEREDNKDRLIDIVIRADGISHQEIKKHLGTTQLLDSGYILHLMQEGISKGKTLIRLLGKMKENVYSLDEVMVFGDSATDLSMFEVFPNNVLVVNPRLPEGQAEMMQERAAYISELQYGEGFTEVALHIVSLREIS